MTRMRWIGIAAVIVVVALVAGFIVLRNGGSTTDTTGQALEAGLAAQVSGDAARAQSKYREVLAEDAGNKFAHYNLGLIDQQAGRGTTAEAAYRRALKTDPDYVPALFNLAILLTERQSQSALVMYRQVIRIQPEYASAHLNLGYLLKKLGQSDDGDAEIAKAVELDPALGQTSPRQTPAPTTP